MPVFEVFLVRIFPAGHSSRSEISSVIRQKGESQNWRFKKTKHAKFFENEHFLTPDTHTYVRVRISG